MIARKLLNLGLVAPLLILVHPSLSYATVFSGARMGVGECLDTDGGAGNLAMNMGVEIGTYSETKFGKRVSLGAEVDQSVCHFRTSHDASVKLNTFGLMLKAAYGYKSGESMIVNWGIGVGPSQANYAATKDKYDIKSTSSAVGLNARAGVEAQMAVTDDISAIGGFNLLFSEIDVSSVKVDPNDGVLDKHDYQKSLGLFIPEFFLGVRVNL